MSKNISVALYDIIKDGEIIESMSLNRKDGFLCEEVNYNSFYSKSNHSSDLAYKDELKMYDLVKVFDGGNGDLKVIYVKDNSVVEGTVGYLLSSILGVCSSFGVPVHSIVVLTKNLQGVFSFRRFGSEYDILVV